MKELTEGAFAKVNLTLDVLDKREDGYHNLRSIMQTVSLHDDVHVTVGCEGWQIHCYREVLPPDADENTEPELVTCGLPQDRENLAWKAAEAFYARIGKKMRPSMIHAGNYSATMQYLKAIEAAGTDDGLAVAQQMKKTKINDVFAKNGYVRADGRMVHDMYLMQVKKPEDSKYPWDYFQLKKVIPAEEAFQPLSLSKCSMVKK